MATYRVRTKKGRKRTKAGSGGKDRNGVPLSLIQEALERKASGKQKGSTKRGPGKGSKSTTPSAAKAIRKKSSRSEAEDLLHRQITLTLPHLEFVREHKFHPTRKWRLDFAFSQDMFAIEIQGGGATGKHMRYTGYKNDTEKMQAATELGWTVIYALPEQVKKGEILTLLEKRYGEK